MTKFLIFEIYKYGENPRNPYLKPRIFDKKYLKERLVFGMCEYFRNDLDKLIIESGLMYGDKDIKFNSKDDEIWESSAFLKWNMLYGDLYLKNIEEIVKTNQKKFVEIIGENDRNSSFFFQISLKHRNLNIKNRCQFFEINGTIHIVDIEYEVKIENSCSI